MKTGSLSKTKIFASILRNDASLYFINFKKVPRDQKGAVMDRVDPYQPQNVYDTYDSVVEQTTGLGKDWKKIDLNKCQIMPSQKDRKVFKLLIDRSDIDKSEKEQRFIASDICSRAIWVKKLLQAKNRTFDGGDDCQGVPLDDMVDLQKQLEETQQEDQGAAAFIDLEQEPTFLQNIE